MRPTDTNHTGRSVTQPCGCSGNCSACASCCGGGCALPAILTPEERDLLGVLSVSPFLPLVQDVSSAAVTLLETGLRQQSAQQGFRLLLRRGLVRMDLGIGLKSYDYSLWPRHLPGSAALTLAGQEALDDLEYGG